MVKENNTEVKAKASKKNNTKESASKTAKVTAVKQDTSVSAAVKQNAPDKEVKAKNNKALVKSTVKVKQIASGAGRLKKQIATLKGLGLNKINREVELEDTVAVRGMINKVKHLIKVI
ncbi:50S ribosomal protein L30 [endosymbiont of Acanthamoeba sp. UWC8]|uniref:50S ribosomal protein L30 n=1 Tax=endosymbiont of Acanthamoeba sp. UWC8 TaxID=86106 RepID=UPI0004D1EE57|nr:50S ribosomal protein L30 [endosymbiont of Acanthamoeba sp. UWC8]